MSFWETLEGVLARFNDLAHDFTWSVMNVTMASLAMELGMDELRWVTMGDERVCPLCREMEGIHLVTELPTVIPAHVLCRCHFEPVA